MTATVVTPFNRRERLKEIPKSVKDSTVKAAHTAVDKVYGSARKVWDKTPRPIQYMLGFGVFCGLVMAWCLGCAWVIFGLLGYNIATLILYYAIACGVPIGLIMTIGDAVAA